MKAELVFRAEGDAVSVGEGVRLYLLAAGYAEESGDDGALRFARGSRWRRVVSFRIEDWPTQLKILLFPVSDEETGVLLRYEVRTGWHLVGALDQAVLEAEAALLDEYLKTGRRRSVGSAVRSVRRPVVVASVLNMVLAAFVVVWVGVLGGFPLPWVALVAVVVAFGDGVMIMAFADILLEGSRSVPRLAVRQGTLPRKPEGDRSKTPSR